MKTHRPRHHSPDNQESRKKGITCQGRFWLERDGITLLGYGRVVLLERIQEYGSISAAAKSMNMSYRHAWDLVDAMNRQAAKPLVVTSKGGKGGGGARLTEEGAAAINSFWELSERFNSFLEQETKKMRSLFP
jgi:molybdate transport system regulatory protein